MMPQRWCKTKIWSKLEWQNATSSLVRPDSTLDSQSAWTRPKLTLNYQTHMTHPTWRWTVTLVTTHATALPCSQKDRNPLKNLAQHVQDNDELQTLLLHIEATWLTSKTMTKYNLAYDVTLLRSCDVCDDVILFSKIKLGPKWHFIIRQQEDTAPLRLNYVQYDVKLSFYIWCNITASPTS